VSPHISPLVVAREKTRYGIRQYFLCVLLFTAIFVIFFFHIPTVEALPTALIASFLIALPAAFVALLLFKAVRFAFNR
jgi:hypothetical protein